MKPVVSISLIALGLALAGLASGCGKPSSPPAKVATNSSNPAMAPLDYLAAQGRAKKFSEKVISQAQIQQAIQQFNAIEDRFPKSLSELVEKHYLQSVPVAPSGYRFDYDPATGEFRAGRQ